MLSEWLSKSLSLLVIGAFFKENPFKGGKEGALMFQQNQDLSLESQNDLNTTV